MAEKIRAGIAAEVMRMKESIGKVPGLAVILVGQRRDSKTYVRNKRIACEEAGINFVMAEFPDTCSEDEVCEALSSFNENPSVHGILVQLPLPHVISLTFDNFSVSLLLSEVSEPTKSFYYKNLLNPSTIACTGRDSTATHGNKNITNTQKELNRT